MSKKSKVSKLTSWNIREYLKAIHRTHILYNCNLLKGECDSYVDGHCVLFDDHCVSNNDHCVLFDDKCEAKAKELVGLNLSRSNGLERKGGDDIFMKQAVLNRLSTLAKRIVGNEIFILEEFLVDYAKAFDFILEKLSKSSLTSDKRMDKAAGLFEYFISYNKSKNTLFNFLFEKDKGYGQVATILILIILKILPPFNGKSRKISNIIEDFDTLYDFCMKLKSKKKPDSFVPEMLLFKVICNNLPKYLNKMKYGNGKIIVFNFAYKLFNSISNHLDKKRLYFMNKNRKQNGYSGYDIDGFWKEEKITNQLWEIKQIKNSPEYIIRRWGLGGKTYSYSSYLLLFTDKSHAYVRGPKYVYYKISEQDSTEIAEQKPGEIAEKEPAEIPYNDIKDIIDYLKVETGDELKPKKLEFESEVSSSCCLPMCLIRSEKSSLNDEESDNLKKKRVYPYNKKEDYYFTPLHAVSHNAVYIKADEDSNFQYYRIPVNREKSLSHIDSSDTAGLVKIGDKKYLAFFDQDIFIDSEEGGIEKVSDCVDWTL